MNGMQDPMKEALKTGLYMIVSMIVFIASVANIAIIAIIALNIVYRKYRLKNIECDIQYRMISK